MPNCPTCGKPAKTVSGLTKHLTGTFSYGGHELDLDTARRLAESAARDPQARTVAVQRTRPVEPSSGAPRAATSPALEQTFLASLFASMAANKALPKYQFERRFDAMLAVLLPDLLGQVLSTDVTFVVPEFPLKKASSNQSTNVDHVYFDRRGRWIFAEIKTDAGSISHEQIAAYAAAAKRGMSALLQDILTIQSATTERAKYSALLGRLDGYPASAPIDLLYLGPSASVLSPTSGMRVVTYRQLAALPHRVYPDVWNLACSTLLEAIG